MKLSLYRSFYLLVALAAILTGCQKEYESIEEIDARNIQAYLSQNKLTLQKHSNGIYYSVIKAGTGPAIEYSEKLPLMYTMRTLEGTYVDTDTIKNRFSNFFGYFSPELLRTTIKEVLKNTGGEIRVIIPSSLAYGRSGSGPIPGNSSLDFTVKILNKSSLPAYEESSIKQYIQANNLSGFSRSPQGIYYKIIEPGTGSPITVDSVVTTQYTGKLFNGTVFDQTSGTASSSFTLSGLIEAWKLIIPLIKSGGTVRFLTPSSLAYGFDGSGNQYGSSIPPFSSLDFEVKVTDVSQP